MAGTVIPNRIVRAAHGIERDDETVLAYHEARARGGVGLNILGTIATADADAVLPFLERVAAAHHRYGSRVFRQLMGSGADFPPLHDEIIFSASDIPDPSLGIVPVPMSISMIDDTVDAFASAARRTAEAGMDGIEIHGAHGKLLQQFLSPALNQRTDDYGGSFDNRLRFLRQVLAATRAAVGPSFPIGLRLSTQDDVAASLDVAACLMIARTVEPDIDYLSVTYGGHWRRHLITGTSEIALGYQIPTSEPVTRHVGVPTMVTGRIMTLDDADRLVANGVADMVSMVRALIADPELVNKARQGRSEEVRPCIGTTVGCLGGVMSGRGFGCVVNVAAGHEVTIEFEPSRTTSRKRVLVVGGGPAGLEVARTAAMRGHDVVLHEMRNHLGGQCAIAASAPHRSDVGAITRWLSGELERLGVAVHLRSLVDVDTIAELEPDEVVVATGSTPRRGFQLWTPAGPVAGADLPHVFTSWDVFGFGGRADVGVRAVVYDDVGSFEAISVADELLARGASVAFISRLEGVGATVPAAMMTVGAARERLAAASVDFIGAAFLVEITPTTVVVGSRGTERRTVVPADTVAIVSFPHRNRELVEALDGLGRPVHTIGDVAGGQSIMTAIHDAARVGRSL